jgi:hypothetical protein
MSNALADIAIPRTSPDEETAFRLRDYFSGLLAMGSAAMGSARPPASDI